MGVLLHNYAGVLKSYVFPSSSLFSWFAEYLVSDTGGQQLSISDAFIKESLFNRRVEEKSKELPFTPLGWHHNNLELLREENEEKQAMERLL